MDQHSPALDSTRVPPVGELHAGIVDQIIRHLNRTSSRKGVTAAVEAEEERVGHWLIECLRRGFFSFPPSPVSLPRGRANHTASARKRVPFPHGAVTRVLNACEAMGWVQVDAGNEQAGYTRVAAAGALELHFAGLGRGWSARPPMPADEILQLGDKDEGVRRPVADDEHPDCPEKRANLIAINGFLMTQCIYLRAPDDDLLRLGREAAGRRTWTRAPVDFGDVDLYRVFTKDLERGGRFYGGWWQSVPKDLRRHIFINQWRGVECDFSGMAVRCAYALEGLDPPDDPYDIGLSDYRGAGDERRAVVKHFVNSILNDKSKRFRLRADEIEQLGISQATLKTLVMRAHGPIAHHFYSDSGLRLQRLDAEIAESVMLQLMKKGIVCLPIHDSFIVAFPHAADLHEAMEAAFFNATGRLARKVWTAPALCHPFEGGLFSPEGLGLVEHANRELDRFSIAREYFGAWTDLHWVDADWESAMKEVADLAQDIDGVALTGLHAFPLRPFANKLHEWAG